MASAGSSVSLDELLHHAEPPRLDARAVQIGAREVVHEVHRVDEELLVRGRWYGPGVVREEVFADVVERVAREVEQLDLFVARFEIATRERELIELLQEHRAIEDEE